MKLDRRSQVLVSNGHYGSVRLDLSTGVLQWSGAADPGNLTGLFGVAPGRVAYLSVADVRFVPRCSGSGGIAARFPQASVGGLYNTFDLPVYGLRNVSVLEAVRRVVAQRIGSARLVSRYIAYTA